MRDRERGGFSRGFAFITFRTQEGADKACSARFVELMNRRVCFVLLSFRHLDRGTASRAESTLRQHYQLQRSTNEHAGQR